MAGYQSTKFFFACFIIEKESRSINMQKNRTRPISSHLDRPSLVTKGFIIWTEEERYFLAGHTGRFQTGKIYWLLTKCEVKMAGYSPSSFITCKKERGQYPAILTEQAWSIKDLLYGFRGNFSCGTRWVVPSGQDTSILPARVANHSAGSDSSCLLTELAT